MVINGKTRVIGFLGATYETSKMYAVYNAAFAALGLNFVYVPFAVAELSLAVAGVRHLGVSAVGVTIPYKISIMPYLDELDEQVQRIGAVSVVVNQNGRLWGGNTDGIGAVRALAEQTAVSGKHITLLGAGGSARAIAFVLADSGANVTIINRTTEKAAELAQAVGCHFDTTANLKNVVAQSHILINTTPIGMANTPQAQLSPVPATWLHPALTVMDIVTHPKETRLLQEAQQAGCALVHGERMLLWQAVDKFKIYTGVEPPIEVMEQALEKR